MHTLAIDVASVLGLRAHVLEEGYLRPYWINYERDGPNGNSRLMDMTVSEMQTVLKTAKIDMSEAAVHWAYIRQHTFYGFAYHLQTFQKKHCGNIQSLRALSMVEEFLVYLRRVLLQPIEMLKRRYKTWHIKSSEQAFYLRLMQLEHGSAFQMYSPFKYMPDGAYHRSANTPKRQRTHRFIGAHLCVPDRLSTLF